MASTTSEAAAARPPLAAAIVATSIPLFMATLDNLVVVFALPVIKAHLGGSAESMQWVINAYALAFASLLLTAAALGDRIGRRKMFVSGIILFTAASAASALAGNTAELITARVFQGAGAAAIVPLSLTLLGAAVPSNMREVAIGIWGGISGLGIAVGPLVSGAVVQGLAWQWIFWLNIPVGLLVLPFVWKSLGESHGPDKQLDLLGLVLIASGVFAMTWAIIRSDTLGWSSAQTLSVLITGVVLVGIFVFWQTRSRTPLMPLRLFRYREFTFLNATAIFFAFGVFGTVFLFAQFFQVAQGVSPLWSGIRTLPWTMLPMLAAPISGLLIPKIGARVIVSTGLALEAVTIGWLASVTTVSAPYSTFVPPFIVGGIGMGMALAPMATVVLSATPEPDHGKASGVNNTLRELGVALGIAVLSAVFAAHGSYASGQAFVNGIHPAQWTGMVIVALGALFSLGLPGRSHVAPTAAEDAATVQPAVESAI